MPVYESRMSSKGQLTVPAAVREHFGLKKGDIVDFYIDTNNEVTIIARNKSAVDLIGMLSDYAKGIPVPSREEITDLVGDALAEKQQRIADEQKEWQEFQEWRRTKAKAAE